jgi:hypothetical protein
MHDSFVATSIPAIVLLVVFALWTWVGFLFAPALAMVSVTFCNPRKKRPLVDPAQRHEIKKRILNDKQKLVRIYS